MIHTDLLKEILNRAHAVKTAYGGAYLCASHVVVAVADFCKTRYTGFAFSDYCYPQFEEELLRYIFSKEVRLASYFSLRLSKNAKDGVREEEFDFAGCENFASSRGRTILSADVLFLCALRDLHYSYKSNLKSISSEDTMLQRWKDAEENVYDYVIDNIAKNVAALQKKADEAMAIRDWKPAAKFAEPEALTERFFGDIKADISGKTVTLKFPKFFGTADLKVSIHKSGGIYYIHDYGCAIRHLSRKVNDPDRTAKILKRVCHACWINRGRITGSFITATQFLYYLQRLIFAAHADLYYTKAEKPLYERDKTFVYMPVAQAEPMDAPALLEELKKSIRFDYDEEIGLYYWLDTRYALFSTRAQYLLQTLENGQIRISDGRKGKIEGEIFEAFYWAHDDIAPYKKFVSNITDRFGGAFDGRDVSLTGKTENITKAMFRFFNLAVLLSEFGHSIAVPRARGKR